jgi:lipopolysaccharide export system protein LptA
LLAVIPAVAIAVAASSAFSSSGVMNPTMVVRADKLSVDYRNKAVLWSGHVQLTLMNYTHYPCTIRSDALRVNYASNFHGVQTAVADGHVRVDQGDRGLTGENAVLDTAHRTIVVTGSPVIHEGQSNIRRSKIIIYLDLLPREDHQPIAALRSRGHSAGWPQDKSAQLLSPGSRLWVHAPIRA